TIWGLFTLAGAGLTGLTVCVILSRYYFRDFVGTVNGLTVTLGLLLFSISAATGLAEERTGGSLDVLLTTPLSTWAIVWGKWWGAFRRFAILAAWPTILIAAMAFGWRRSLWPPYGGYTSFPKPSLTAGVFWTVLMAAYLLAHGAMITSLGLALATWISRQGRAAALCASYFVAVCLGWPFLCFLLLPDSWPEHMARNAAMLSPLIGFPQLVEVASCPGIT